MSGEDQARTISLTQVLRSAMARRLVDVHIGLPGEVQSYDPNTQTADVQPQLMAHEPQEDGAVIATPLPVLAAIPVEFPAAGGFRLVLPVQKGDTGWIMFSEASLDAWQAQGGLVDPKDQRRFHLADAVFRPGLHPNTKPLTGANNTDASFGKDGAHQVVITPTGIELGGNDASRPTDFVALAQKVLTELQSIKASHDGHTHVVPPGGITVGATTFTTATPVTIPAPTVPMPAPQSVASALVKSK